MDSKEFKNVFSEIAKENNFAKAFGGWFKESSECIAVLSLEKSNYSDYYKLLIKIYIQGVFGEKYVMNKDLVKKDVGDIFIGVPKEYIILFQLDNPMEDNERVAGLISVFQNFINPYVSKIMTRHDIIDMHLNHGLFLLPAIKKELGI